MHVGRHFKICKFVKMRKHHEDSDHRVLKYSNCCIEKFRLMIRNRQLYCEDILLDYKIFETGIVRNEAFA